VAQDRDCVVDRLAANEIRDQRTFCAEPFMYRSLAIAFIASTL
jgi:hypothetical protein